MNNPNYVSEVAALRARIEAECLALQHLTLFASTASHEVIAAKHKNLDDCRIELSKVVGEKEATSTIFTIYNETVN